MSEAAIRRYAGLFGLFASLFIIVQVPLCFIDETPPGGDILTPNLIAITGSTVYIAYVIGRRHLIRHVNPAYDWIASVVQLAGLLWMAMVFVPQPMEVGAAITVDHDIDTTTEGPFAAAQYLVQGAVSRLLVGAAHFSSAQGWGTTASMGALWSLWTLAVSISILRGSRRAAPASAGGRAAAARLGQGQPVLTPARTRRQPPAA